MATKTFSDTQLATLWAKTKANGGTRRDVVLGLMTEMNIANTGDAYRKVYNNVTQRVKNLAQGTPPVVFPELTKGKKGARKAASDLASIQAILNGPATDAPATPPTEEVATQAAA